MNMYVQGFSLHIICHPCSVYLNIYKIVVYIKKLFFFFNNLKEKININCKLEQSYKFGFLIEKYV